METNEILQADVLDILFEHRNKEYGAYQLRKTYNKRLVRAMLVTGGVIGMVFMAGLVSGHGRGKGASVNTATEVVLEAVPDPPAPPPPPPPPPPKPQVQVATIRMVTTRIVPDDQVKKEDVPPQVDDADNMRIGTVNQAGVVDNTTAPPVPVNSGGTGVVEGPKKEESTFIPIEKEAEYPGGLEAWRRFVMKNLQYPEDAQSREIEGVVMVRFIVDKDGNVSDVQVESGPDQGGLREEAVRVIKRSGKWTPALQNGRYVKTYKQQPVVFKMEHE